MGVRVLRVAIEPELDRNDIGKIHSARVRELDVALQAVVRGDWRTLLALGSEAAAIDDYVDRQAAMAIYARIVEGWRRGSPGGSTGPRRGGDNWD